MPLFRFPGTERYPCLNSRGRFKDNYIASVFNICYIEMIESALHHLMIRLDCGILNNNSPVLLGILFAV
jgi:hypothetical protein